MRTILVLLLTTSLFYGCKKIRGCRPEQHHYTFAAARQIDTIKAIVPDDKFTYYRYEIKEGGNIVFRYVHEFEDCPDLADDEGMRTILFEVPATAATFTINDSAALQQHKTLLAQSCECIPYLPVFFKSGGIEGRKISNNKWHIKATLKAPWDDAVTISFEKDFIKE